MTRIWPTIQSAQDHAARTAVAPLVWDPKTHLLSRFAFGATTPDLTFIHQHGAQGWWNEQLLLVNRYPGYAGNAVVRTVGPMLALSPAQVRAELKAAGNEYGWTAMDQLTQVTLGLQAWSKTQVYETVVDFFSNHLNVANHNGDVWHTRAAYDRDVIRKYAFGSFTDMLLASARHPAMLIYLNLADSTKQAVNENYGRELLELHTVGLHYTQNDVVNAARLLTGRTVDSSESTYRYDAARHWTGPVQVLGFRSANATAAGGEAVGDAFLRYLAAHPQTANNLAHKLCVRYVSDNPSAALVTAVANAYLASKTQILPMLETILRSDEFWASRGAKRRRPAESLVATVRVLGLRASDVGAATSTMHWMTAALGQVPLDWSAPNGYPDVAAAWRSSGALLTQWNYNLGFAGNWWQGFAKTDLTGLYGGAQATCGVAIDRLIGALTQQPFTAAHRAALQTFVGEPASTPMAKSNLRWLLYPLVALILDSPHHALR